MTDTTTGWVGVSHLLTSRQVAQALQVSPKTVAGLRRAGQLAAVRVASTWRYHPDALAAYITTHTQQPEEPQP